MCKEFLRIPPHFGLWLKTFNVKPKVVDGEHAYCGGAMVSKLPHATWPQGAFVDTVKTWQQEWFYITAPRGSRQRLPPVFRSGPPQRLTPWVNNGRDWGPSKDIPLLQDQI